MNINEIIKSIQHTANELERINVKVHGDLYGCDCEGGCSCKPALWYDLEELKYHCLGTICGLEESDKGLTPL